MAFPRELEGILTVVTVRMRDYAVMGYNASCWVSDKPRFHDRGSSDLDTTVDIDASSDPRPKVQNKAFETDG